MITNRDEVLENAFKVFVKMNYEKASFTEIAKACGWQGLALFIISLTNKTCLWLCG